MLLGTCISITDAVEVVHLLSKEGYSDKFRTLLECEALLNDATGIIFYMLFAKMSNEHHPLQITIFGVIIHFLKHSGIGFLIGYFFSALCKI